MNDNDKVSIYLELADAYRMANQEADAKQVMEEATLMFKVRFWNDTNVLDARGAQLISHALFGDTQCIVHCGAIKCDKGYVCATHAIIQVFCIEWKR